MPKKALVKPRKDDNAALSAQLDKQRRQVSYDSYDILIRQLVELVADDSIDIAPEYQRHFVWGDVNQSRFIESIFLGIPSPSLYMATNPDSTWEVIDGVQRISTVIRFCGDEEHLRIIQRQPLMISGLENLTALNDRTFHSLPKSLQLSFMMKSLKVTTLNDKSDLSVRFDLFERLNTGGVRLEDQEIRACIYRGKYNDFLRRMADNAHFRAVVKLQEGNQHNGTFEEFVLRFFAFLHAYQTFEHDVKEYLNEFMESQLSSFDETADADVFNKTFKLLATKLPNGIVRLPRKITPVNLYEGIAVGTGLAILSGRKPKSSRLPSLLDDEELRKFTTAATNSQRMVSGRIEYVRNQLLKA